MQRWPRCPCPRRQSAGVFCLVPLGYRSPMGLWDRPNILDAKSGLRPREIAIVFAIITALCVVVAIVLL
jgi:hypothetical protein